VCFGQPGKFIRVAILQDAPSLSLNIGGYFEIIDAKSKRTLHHAKSLKTTVTASKNGILIGSENFYPDKVIIQASKSAGLAINGRKFRGNIQFIRKDNSSLLVVNYLGLEDYIKGILYHEVSHYWPLEILKAQAVVCRTYALNQIEVNKGKDFDVTADIYSQVYGGRTSERYRTSKAVDETRGEILTYQGKVFPAYFHATCAGYTEDASLLWNINIAPLKGVHCGFCQDSPHFKWHNVLNIDELRQTLEKSGYRIKEIKDILIGDRDKSGRIVVLKFINEKETLNISAKDFRNIIGPNIIRSTNFTVKLADNDAVFVGYGWGHGVGLCQWGGYFMAKSGYNYQEILRYYYPGSLLESLD
jgi:stage II sporulation protein D